MTSLPNNCRAGNFSVYPSDWNKPTANKDLQWRITYWFFDDNTLKRMQIKLMGGINKLQKLKDKRDGVKALIAHELHKLEELGFNPITKTFATPGDNEITERTPFLPALEYALEKIDIQKTTKDEISKCMRYFKPAVKMLRFDQLPIGQVKRRHIKIIFDKIGTMNIIPPEGAKPGPVKKKIWTANQYNHYRAHISMLFAELLEYEVVDVNPLRSMKKKSSLKKIRETTTKEERERIDKFLHANYYTFWRFVQIFHHSSARITELLQIRKQHVFIDRQQYMVVVKKGKKHHEELRTIKTIALPLWVELMAMAKENHILFSVGLQPGSKPITRKMITNRWKVHVKEKLGITADIYSLKHSNLDAISARLGLRRAKEAAGHTSESTTMIYAVGEKERQHEILKEVNNAFTD